MHPALLPNSNATVRDSVLIVVAVRNCAHTTIDTTRMRRRRGADSDAMPEEEGATKRDLAYRSRSGASNPAAAGLPGYQWLVIC